MTDHGSKGDPGPRRPGRPPVAERMELVTARVPSATYDRLVRAANLQNMTVSRLVRELLILRIPRE